MELKIAICDDMDFFVERTKRCILEWKPSEDDYEICEFTSGKGLLSYIENNKQNFDVIFLDIGMPEMDGIEVATKIREKDTRVIIIFLTSYDKYMKEGYRVRAFRYLSKNSETELSEALQSVRKMLTNRKRIIIPDMNGNHHIFSSDEIIYGEIEGRNMRIYTEREEILTSLTLQKFQELVEESCFFRCHRAFIVNIEHIWSYSLKEIHMDNDKKVFLSRGRYNNFKEQYAKWIFEN